MNTHVSITIVMIRDGQVYIQRFTPCTYEIMKANINCSPFLSFLPVDECNVINMVACAFHVQANMRCVCMCVHIWY